MPLPSTSAKYGLGLCCFIWVVSTNLCAVMSVKKWELSQMKPSNWGFFVSLSGDVLEIDVFYSLYVEFSDCSLSLEEKTKH